MGVTDCKLVSWETVDIWRTLGSIKSNVDVWEIRRRIKKAITLACLQFVMTPARWIIWQSFALLIQYNAFLCSPFLIRWKVTSNYCSSTKLVRSARFLVNTSGFLSAMVCAELRYGKLYKLSTRQSSSRNGRALVNFVCMQIEFSAMSFDWGLLEGGNINQSPTAWAVKSFPLPLPSRCHTSALLKILQSAAPWKPELGDMVK